MMDNERDRPEVIEVTAIVFAERFFIEKTHTGQWRVVDRNTMEPLKDYGGRVRMFKRQGVAQAVATFHEERTPRVDTD